ncbi:phage replisome organizer N-terminal domain-containing protein [Clostridium fungisolvens]|uniref:Phage replisome organiser N-terminal domain-containing protein n=1 Tax=Clostridium fungisolvens TaxID=1604897 RepID=A0A6V8S9Z9_9CLOT|nr:phage replisome organizer N-terminal domain-containing protein [Clostridium fungisolvens]GFP74079.1 hypothetical protein bsdtw1_00118 [Clostridium fungisolvens]
MRERKYVKFRVDMYEDTKFKIIDMKPERDVIHYIWNRLVLLAGKVNLEGDLFFSKNIEYTIETLAIEFNRDASQIKLALEVFIELEMIELTDDKVYKVKNFVKHQNIKVKKKGIYKNEGIEIKNVAIELNEDCSDQVKDSKYESFRQQVGKAKDKNNNEDNGKDNDNISINSSAEAEEESNGETLECKNKEVILIDEGKEHTDESSNLLESSSKQLETKKSVRINKKKKKSKSRANHIDEIVSYDEIAVDVEDGFADRTKSLGKYETSIAEWSFG